MTTGSADSVKQLRDRTGAGMMDCKAALLTTNGDIEKAIDVLRKKGVAQAAKLAGREAKEGLVIARVEGKKAALVEANCETDFVARTEDFKNLALLALEETLSQGEKALASEKITQKVAELSAKIGEKILIRRNKLVTSDQGVLFVYIHSNHKLGVVLEIVVSDKSKKNPELTELGKNLAMQVAAASPIAVTRKDISPAIVEREKAIFKEEVKGKPENIVEKIIQGKLVKFYQSGCLLEQPFIRDDKLSVQSLIKQVSDKIGDPIEIRQFTRFQLGESPVSCSKKLTSESCFRSA